MVKCYAKTRWFSSQNSLTASIKEKKELIIYFRFAFVSIKFEFDISFSLTLYLFFLKERIKFGVIFIASSSPNNCHSVP